MKDKKVALVLSGGGALGIAHIGVLKALLENNINIDIICGTSMGAIVGGLYCSGKSIDDLLDIVANFKRKDFMDINFFLMLKNGLIKSGKAFEILEEFVGNKLIENSKIKYGCTAADLNSGKIVNFTKGTFKHAMLCSMSLPGIFNPVEHDDMLLVDGGILDNLPTELAKELGADYIIAVDVFNYDYCKRNNNNVFNIIINSMMLSNHEIIKYKTKCDIFIKPNMPNVSMDKFDKDEMERAYQYGYEETKAYINKIKNDLNIK